ncbi:MAG: serine/threonine-protein kinase RsbW [Solirubrobacteraceae bacterium]|jgi:anti-sigma regulatory factor (Ser/Thr protein kinase)|nr:serine/threonine-protein kinase RsbW [Solirubrobacteraceae bacterium]
MSGTPDVRLRLPNLPENVALVRQALTGLAGSIGIDDSLLADIKTAVSEACNNVVLHAYDNGGVGPLDVYVCPSGHEVAVVVKDQGTGIQPRAPDPDAAMQGVGLSLIQALTRSVEFGGGDGEGTEVRMEFHSEAPLDVPESDDDGDAAVPAPPQGETVVSASDPLVAPVLSSVIAVLAARAGFSVERLSEAQLVTDAIAAHAGSAFVGPHVHAGIDTTPHQLELRLGPLVDGGSDTLVAASAVGGLAPVLERLADDVTAESRDGHEELRLVISDRH